MKIRLLLNGSFRSFFRLHIGWGSLRTCLRFPHLIPPTTSADACQGSFPVILGERGVKAKQRDQNRSDRLAESVNRRGLTFSLPVKGQLLSEEQILGREGGSGSGQSDSEPEDIVDQA
jgi:hypothetical protein